MIVEYELNKLIEIENLVVVNGFVVDKTSGEVIGQVFTY